MATKYVNQIADDGEYVRVSMAWTAEQSGEEVLPEALIDVSALSEDPATGQPVDSVSITKVWFNGHLTITTNFADNATAVYLLDSNNDGIISFDRDADGFQNWECFGGLPDTKSYSSGANGDLKIGCGHSLGSNGAFGTANLERGSNFHIVVEARKNYQRPS